MQRVASIRICLFLLLGWAVGLVPSQVFARCGMVDTDVLAINVSSLTGLSSDQLVLMPAVRYHYSSGLIKTKFGTSPKTCSGPLCDQLPDGNRALGDMSIESVDYSAGALMVTRGRSVIVDDLKGEMNQFASQFFEEVSELPSLRPPISLLLQVA